MQKAYPTIHGFGSARADETIDSREAEQGLLTGVDSGDHCLNCYVSGGAPRAVCHPSPFARERLRSEADKASASPVSLVAPGGAADIPDENFRQLVEVRGTAIIVSDGGKALFANQAAARLFGYDSTDMILALPGVDRLVCRTQRRILNKLSGELHLTPGKHAVYEARGLRVDGSCFPVEVVLDCVEWNGRPAIAATLIDLTERQNAQRIAMSQIAELAHFERICTLGEMSAAIMHEIAQPLTALSLAGGACTRLLAKDEPDVGNAVRAARTIEGQATRMRETVDRIKQFAAGGAVRNQQPREKVDAASVIEQAFMLTAPTINQARVIHRTHLRCTPDERMVHVDPIQLNQVLVNLLLNAVEAIRETGKSDGRINVSVSRRDENVRIDVSDNGPGVPPGLSDQIFESFFSTKEKGMGIGLSVCCSIIESFGGRLELLRHRRRGAAFRITLPAYGGSDD